MKSDQIICVAHASTSDHLIKLIHYQTKKITQNWSHHAFTPLLLQMRGWWFHQKTEVPRKARMKCLRALSATLQLTLWPMFSGKWESFVVFGPLSCVCSDLRSNQHSIDPCWGVCDQSPDRYCENYWLHSADLELCAGTRLARLDRMCSSLVW